MDVTKLDKTLEDVERDILQNEVKLPGYVYISALLFSR